MIKNIECIKHKLCIFFCFILVSWISATSVVAGVPGAPQSTVTKTDTLYFRIADSTFSGTELAFTIEMYRPNDNWGTDQTLGEFDLYFKYGSEVSSSSIPDFTWVNTAIVDERPAEESSLTGNLLGIYTRFHGELFYGISARATGGSGVYTIPVREDPWIKLCEVVIPIDNYGGGNFNIEWDTLASGAMTSRGEPIESVFFGDIIKNPEAVISTKGLVVTPEKQCQGEQVYVYVDDAVSSGTQLKYTWFDSINGDDERFELGTFEASTLVKEGQSKDGRYEYEILGAGDTLLIRNTTAAVDGMSFFCVLSDESIGMPISNTIPVVGPKQVHLRDSLFGYFASTTPRDDFGMTPEIFTDTVTKCPDASTVVNIYFFGVEEDELSDWGDQITVHYVQDLDMNPIRWDINIPTNELQHIPADAPGNTLGKDLFFYPYITKLVGRLHIESIKTPFCRNGISYSLYDTLVIKEGEGETIIPPPIELCIGEEIALDIATDDPKSYFIEIQTPGLNGSNLKQPNEWNGYVTTYQAPDVSGMDTLIYTATIGGCESKAKQPVKVTTCSYLTAKVILAGPYMGEDDNGVDSMRCGLMGVFPKTNFEYKSPYADNLKVNIKDTKDRDFGGTICDWIYVKIRDGENGVYVDSISAFLRQDGIICDVSGVPYLKFEKLDRKPYNVVIEHRNHLSIMSLPISFDDSEPTALLLGTDFTVLTNLFDNNTSDKNITLCTYDWQNCMIPCDVISNGIITVRDRSEIKIKVNFWGYQGADVNFDQIVNANDLRQFMDNVNKFITF